MKMNKHYNELKASYLFVDIAHKVAAYQEAHPEKEIIRLGIGDVTQPLAKCVVKAMHDAADEMGTKEGFHGYGPEQGYPFLKQAIQGYYAGRGTKIAEDEIFISDGAKSDLANVLGLFDVDNTVLVPDPVYPTYVDDNVTDGRKIIYSRTSQENGFLGMPDENVKADIIYICRRAFAVEPDSFRQADRPVRFIDVCQRRDVKFRFRRRAAVALQGAAEQDSVHNHEQERRPYNRSTGKFVQNRPPGFVFPVNLKIDRSPAAFLIPYDAVAGACQNFRILELQLIGAVGVPEEILQRFHVERPSRCQRTILPGEVEDRRSFLSGAAAAVSGLALIEQNRSGEPEIRFIRRHHFHLLPPYGFD